jgi:hypothetical protein
VVTRRYVYVCRDSYNWRPVAELGVEGSDKDEKVSLTVIKKNTDLRIRIQLLSGAGPVGIEAFRYFGWDERD